MRPAQLQDKLYSSFGHCSAQPCCQQKEMPFAGALQSFSKPTAYHICLKKGEEVTWKLKHSIGLSFKGPNPLEQTSTTKPWHSKVSKLLLRLVNSAKQGLQENVFPTSQQPDGLFFLGIQKVRIVAKAPLRVTNMKYTFHRQPTNSCANQHYAEWTSAPQSLMTKIRLKKDVSQRAKTTKNILQNNICTTFLSLMTERNWRMPSTPKLLNLYPVWQAGWQARKAC